MADDPWLVQRLRAIRGFVTGEARIRQSWLAAATSWTESVIGAVMAPFRTTGGAPDASAVLSQNDEWVRQLNERVRPSVLDVIRSGWASLLGRQPPQAFDAARNTQQYLTDSVNRMVNTPDEVYRQVSAIIADGLNEGQSIPQIAARVDEALTVANNPTWANRGTVVARTEATGAVNFGEMTAAFARAAEEGRAYVKRWLATDDNRTRHWHDEADNQVVPLGEPFGVGPDAMMYPGDPAGSAANVIQCRCTALYELADEQPTSLIDRQNP